MRPPTRRALLLGLGAVVLAGGGLRLWWYLERRYPYYHFRTVQAGVLYRTGQLSSADLAEAVARYGIRTVVNLRAADERGPWHAAQVKTAARLGIRHLDVPLPAGHPPTQAQVGVLCALFDDPGAVPVLVHCHRGSIRSAAVEGLFRREYLREGPEEALDRVELFSHDVEDYPLIEAFIRGYRPREPVAPTRR